MLPGTHQRQHHVDGPRDGYRVAMSGQERDDQPAPRCDRTALIDYRYWGYTTFRPLQREAMDAVIASLGEQERYRSCERGGHELSGMPPMSCAGKGKAASASAEILTLR